MPVLARSLLVTLLLMGITPAPAAEIVENMLGMRFVRIPAGDFLMGTQDVEAARLEIPDPKPDDVLDETPPHKVILSRDFYLGETEVTQGVWLKVMENRPGPEEFWQPEDWRRLPVAAASWFMAERFIEELNKLDPHFRYRLPTEAEWEYAARAGSGGLRPFSDDDAENFAWFINNSGDKPQPVATRNPNGFGLYDMFGNVWEWVSDWYAPDTYSAGARTNPPGPAKGRAKVRRGGSYHCPFHLIRSGYRAANAPETRYSVTGFRLVAELR